MEQMQKTAQISSKKRDADDAVFASKHKVSTRNMQHVNTGKCMSKDTSILRPSVVYARVENDAYQDDASAERTGARTTLRGSADQGRWLEGVQRAAAEVAAQAVAAHKTRCKRRCSRPVAVAARDSKAVEELAEATLGAVSDQKWKNVAAESSACRLRNACDE